jgi:MFS family permease
MVTFATTIWGGAATTLDSLIGARVLGAFFGSTGEAVAAAVTADLFFLHERGWWMGVYMVCQSTGSTIGGLISGFLVAKGWRWHFWVYLAVSKLIEQLTGIICGLNALSILLFFPETRFSRTSVMGNESVEEIPRVSTEKETPSDTVQEPTDSAQHSNLRGTKKTFLQELKPWSTIDTKSNYLGVFLRPWPMIVYPATLYAFLTFSAVLAWYICIYATYASVFQRPPYNMSPGVSSLINIPSSIGCLIGAYCGGGLTDTFVKYRARRNNGVFEPETRLVAMVIPFFLVPVGLLM